MLRHNCNETQVQNAKCAWQEWEALGRSSLKDVILAEDKEDLTE